MPRCWRHDGRGKGRGGKGKGEERRGEERRGEERERETGGVLVPGT
jgi:hypothetical protein